MVIKVIAQRREVKFGKNPDKKFVKDELKNTSIQITCLDEDGNVLKRLTSGDSGDITGLQLSCFH